MGVSRAAVRKAVSRQQSRSFEGAQRCRRKFLRFFPNGFRDEKYFAWERGYKVEAHERWNAELGEPAFAKLLRARQYSEIAQHAVRIESRTNLLFSFEKMALRDAVKSEAGRRLFATELYGFLYGGGRPDERFTRWIDAVSRLPRKQTRVLTWPLVTVFGFIARPDEHIFLKPKVTRIAAEEYGFPFAYESRPNWDTCASLLGFAAAVGRDNRDLHPRDMIDVQSFLWVQGSGEYEE